MMEVFYFFLGLGFQTIPFVAAVVLALGLVFFCLVTYSRPAVAVGAGGVAYVLDMLLGSGGSLNLGLSLSVVDLYFLALGLVVAIRWLTACLPTQDRLVRLWLLIAVVWGLSFVVGLAQFKTAAGVEFRGSYYFLAAVLYLLSFRLDADQVGRVFRALYGIALTLACLALYRWAAVVAGVTGDWFDPHTPLRVLSSGQTMVIAMAMLPGLAMWMKLNAPRPGMMYMAPLLLLEVLVLGHRTVWLVTMAALVAAWWLAGRRHKAGRSGLLAPLLVGAIVLGSVFVLAPGSVVSQEFQRSVAETQQKNSTLAWRVDSWKSLIDDWVASGPSAWPAGKPFGAGYRRFIESQNMETVVGAHSHYVGILVRGGILVLFAYLAVQWIVLRRLLRRSVLAPDWLGGDLPAVFVLANLVYAIGYSPDFMQALFLGLAYSMAVNTQAGPKPESALNGNFSR